MEASSPRPLDPEDLARLVALEHLVTTLWTGFVANQADAHRVPASEVAQEFSDALHGSIVDGGWDALTKAMVRGHLKRIFGGVIVNAETMDRLAGG